MPNIAKGRMSPLGHFHIDRGYTTDSCIWSESIAGDKSLASTSTIYGTFNTTLRTKTFSTAPLMSNCLLVMVNVVLPDLPLGVT